MNIKFLNYLLVLTGFGLLTGCSQVNKAFGNEETVGYKKAGAVSSLEVPPDLTTPEYDSTFAVGSTEGTVSASTVNPSVSRRVGANVSVLPESAIVQLKGAGNARWLEVAAPAGSLWGRVQGFWASVGAELKRNEPTVGVMETDWIQTRGHLPQGSIQRALGSILKNATDSGIRDRYTVRFEKASASMTRVYMTHRGAELMVSDTGNKWEMRPRNSAAEAEMLNRLKAYLQGSDASSATSTSSTESVSAPSSTTGLAIMSTDTKGRTVLKVSDSYDRAWIRTGSVLTSAGFSLEGQDKGKGLYAAIWEGDGEKKKGFFGRLTSSRNSLLPSGTQQLIHVSKSGNTSVLRILDEKGSAANAKVSKRVLERLRTEFNR